MKYGLIGAKLSHSFSKQIHQLLAPTEYNLWEIDESSFDEFMAKKDFDAINVTIPYKQKVIPYLHYIDENAAKIGAVNTIVNKNGKLFGYNTDFGGLKLLLEKYEFEIENSNVLILGTGGTSKTASAVCSSMNAKSISFVSRNGDINYQNVNQKCPDTEYIINTTPCGMFPNIYDSSLDISSFLNLKGVADVIYNPLKTSICIQAEHLGLKHCNGLYMLVSQAVLASEYFLNKKYPLSIYDKIYAQIFNKKRNIVFIGMPGCGKSTFSQMLFDEFGFPRIDTDEMISKSKGRSPSEVITLEGEKYFRQIESEVIKEVSSANGYVIATGGGAVLNSENIINLKRNGTIVFIDRPISDIVPTNDRPLSSNIKLLQQRYNERFDLYNNAADIIIDGSGSKMEVYQKIKQELNL